MKGALQFSAAPAFFKVFQDVAARFDVCKLRGFAIVPQCSLEYQVSNQPLFCVVYGWFSGNAK